jgi:hypothetical protein
MLVLRGNYAYPLAEPLRAHSGRRLPQRAGLLQTSGRRSTSGHLAALCGSSTLAWRNLPLVPFVLTADSAWALVCRKGTAMRRRSSRLLSIIAMLIVLWLIWSKLHIVVVVSPPWWALLLVALVLFLVIDYTLDRILGRSS